MTFPPFSYPCDNTTISSLVSSERYVAIVVVFVAVSNVAADAAAARLNASPGKTLSRKSFQQICILEESKMLTSVEMRRLTTARLLPMHELRKHLVLSGRKAGSPCRTVYES